MKSVRKPGAALLAIAGFLTALATSGASRSDTKAASPAERERAIHVLNRLGFGPRPGDVDRVLAMGVDAYVREQLAPEKIPDPSVAATLDRFPTLAMTTAELYQKFEKPVREARQEKKRTAGMTDTAAPSDEDLRLKIAFENRPRRLLEELSEARILRAARSERQLNEVLVDFWMNHFNVFGGKGLDRIFLTEFERDVIRPHIWGKFEDLLMATATSPAMLFYLDNAQSVADPEHRAPRVLRFGRMFGGAAKPAAGLNENYARELMELHTLGVDGGYTQRDVTELARVFTGWSIFRPEQGTGFVFRGRLHDADPKTVLGVSFPAGGGIEEGEKMIRILARHPATARHIAFKLCQKFVADEPPAGLVDRVAKRFLDTDGDLGETVRAVVTSREFFDSRYYRAKVKSPFEYVISAVRAMGAATDNGLPIARQLVQMGEGLYLCQPPTGYSDTAEAWVNSGALVARLNFAIQLAANRLPGTWADAARLIPPGSGADPRNAVDALSCALIGKELSAETRSTIETSLDCPANDTVAVQTIAGLILGSPEFQRQ